MVYAADLKYSITSNNWQRDMKKQLKLLGNGDVTPSDIENVIFNASASETVSRTFQNRLLIENSVKAMNVLFDVEYKSNLGEQHNVIDLVIHRKYALRMLRKQSKMAESCKLILKA